MPITDNRYNLLNARVNQLIVNKKEVEAIHAVAQYDGKEAIPVLVRILKQIIAINEKELEASFHSLTNSDLAMAMRGCEKKETFSATFFNATMGKTIREYFEVVIGSGLSPSPRSYYLKDINQKLVDEKLSDILKKVVESKILKNRLDAKSHKDKPDQFNLFEKYLRTQVILDFLIEVYSDSDRKQNVSDENQTSEFAEFALYKERLKKPFIILVLACNKLFVSDETKPLWHQAAIWLSGLHLRVYKIMCELNPALINEHGDILVKDEQYPTVDAEDKSFNDNLGCTKMWMSKRHEEVSERIDVGMKELNKIIKAMHPDYKTKKPFVFTVNEEEIKTMLAQPAKPLSSSTIKPEKLDIRYVEKDGMLELVIRLPKDKSKEMKVIRDGVKCILEKPVLNVKEWSERLAISISDHTWCGGGDVKIWDDIDVETKIRKLQLLMDKFSLPLELSGLSRSILYQASSCPREYANSVSFWSITGAFKTGLYLLKGQANTSDANNLYQVLAELNTPTEQINKLIEIHQDLKSKGSKGLLAIIEKILSNAFDDILTGKVLAVEEEEQKKDNVVQLSLVNLPLGQQQMLFAQAKQQVLMEIQQQPQAAAVKKK